MPVDLPDKRNVSAIGKTGIGFNSGARGTPVEIEIVHEDGALRVAHIESITALRPCTFACSSNTRMSPMFISN